MINFSHKSVMLNQCIEGLALKDDGIYFDGTIGGGGHSFEILKRTKNAKLIATDLDDDAILAASKRLEEFSGRFKIVKSNYKDFDKVLDDLEIDLLDGVLLDFGVSSYQLDTKDRGFSYMAKEAPLDMRMDQSSPLTAEIVVNEYEEKKLVEILRKYGEEKFAPSIVKNIVEARRKNRLKTCGELVKIIETSIPKKFQQNGPCSRKTFQAIRIEVNDELSNLYETVLGFARRLKVGGRIVVLTFHSLEDRIVKNAFNYLECDCICDKSLPVCVCGKKKEIKIVTNKPITASEEELNDNTRAKCAKLRIAERVAE